MFKQLIESDDSIMLFSFINKYYRNIQNTDSELKNFKILDFPILILNTILSYLDKDTLLSFRQVNKKCNIIFDKCNISFENNILNCRKLYTGIETNDNLINFNIKNNLRKIIRVCITQNQLIYIDKINTRFNNNNPKIYYNVLMNIDSDSLKIIKYIRTLQIDTNMYNKSLYDEILTSETNRYIKILFLINPNIESLKFSEKLINLKYLKLSFTHESNVSNEVYNYICNSKLIQKINSLYILVRINDDIDWTILLNKCTNIKHLFIYFDIHLNNLIISNIYKCISSMIQLKTLLINGYRCFNKLDLPDDMFYQLKSLKYLIADNLNIHHCKDLINLEQLYTDYVSNFQKTYIEYMKNLSILGLNIQIGPYYKYHGNINLFLRI